MSELAFNANGDNFEIPANVTGWRVRRMKPRGAPELVYGRDGRPLVLPIEADMDDLREAVGQLGRYRLDPVNEDGKVIEGLSPAYIQVVKTERTVEPVAPARGGDESESVVKEAMRLNTELARSVIEKFPDVMTAAAELLRAADGAGIPARVPRAVEVNAHDEDVDDEEPTAPRFDLAGFLGHIIPMAMAAFQSGSVKMPDLASALDWRKAVPKSSPKKSTPTVEASTPKAVSNPAEALPPIEPQMMAHFIAVQSALKPEEAALAREVAGELAPAELRAWFDELGALRVPDAVAKIRSLIGKGGAS